MKRLITICLAGFLVFFGSCGKQEPQKEQKEVEVEKEAVEEVAAVNEPNMPAEIAEPNELMPGRGFGRRAGYPRRPRPEEGVDVNEVAEPNELEFVNLKDAPMKDIIEKLADWTGKVIIPADEAMKERITIYSSGKLPRKDALAKVYGALRMKGYIAEHTDDTIYIKSVQKAKIGFVPTIEPNQPLAMIENKEQVVQKFFRLENYSVTRMSEILQPLISEYGYISADESSSNLLVIDSVANLMRLESIIKQFDIPGAEQTEVRIFEDIADPSEIVQILNMALGAQMTSAQRSRIEQLRRAGRPSGSFGPSFSPRSSDSRSSGSSSNPGNPGNPGPSNPESSSLESSNPESSRLAGDSAAARARTERAKAEKKVSGAAATSVIVGVGVSEPPILIPDPKRGLVIVRASPADMKKIADLIDELTRLDLKAIKVSQYDVITIKHVDVDVVATSISNMLRDLSTEISANVVVQPVSRTKQLLVFGSVESRELIKELVGNIDVPDATLFEQRTFKLRYIPCEELKEKIDELYGAGAAVVGISRYPSSRRGAVSAADEVRTVAYPTLNQLTVIASPGNLEMIAEQIKEWDVPLDVEKVKPLIIELYNTDPVVIAELLTKSFSEETTGIRGIQQFLRGGALETRKEVVGPLYGQFTVEAVPGTRKIIVLSKIPEAYKVIENLVRELDKEVPPELPVIVTLKYADPEDLAERLNATFNEPGTSARIRYAEKGIEVTVGVEEGAEGAAEPTTTSEYTPWWSGSGARAAIQEEMPISNVIGRVRFTPEPRTKSIIVLCPPEYVEGIKGKIAELDIPGKQVLIKAIVVEVDYSKITSLGVQLASNPTVFGTLNENSATAKNILSFVQSYGALGTGGSSGSFPFKVDTSTEITALVDFLIKKAGAKILNQQTLYTKDNEVAQFFKGKKVAFYTGAITAAAVGITQNVEFDQVGMTLGVRPNITPENKVAMSITVGLSQLTSELVNNQPVRILMETKANMIVEDSQTILLAEILSQEDSLIERKLPLLGDVPLIGGLFRHNSTIKSDSEMLIFITPHVVEEGKKQEDIADVKDALEKMESTTTDLDEMSEWLEEGE